MEYSTGDNLFMLASEYNKCYRDLAIWARLIRDKLSSWYIEDEDERDNMGILLNDMLDVASRGGRSIAVSRLMADKKYVQQLLDHMAIAIDTDVPYDNHYLLRW